MLSTTMISPCGRLGGQHALESQTLDLLVQHVAVAAGLGGKHDAAVGPLRGAGAALTGAAGALLAPGLSAAAGNLSAGQSALRALTAVGQMVLDDFMHNGSCSARCRRLLSFSSTAPTSAPAMLDNFDRRHLFKHSFPYIFLAEAFCGLRPEAFCGFLLMSAPACLILWTLTVVLTVDEAALGTGNRAADDDHVELGVDLDDLKVLDGDLLHTQYWPGPILPLKIRLGSVVEPMEPA